jgi:hypothetical protein
MSGEIYSPRIIDLLPEVLSVLECTMGRLRCELPRPTFTILEISAGAELAV